jgi:hypothetical protein
VTINNHLRRQWWSIKMPRTRWQFVTVKSLIWPWGQSSRSPTMVCDTSSGGGLPTCQIWKAYLERQKRDREFKIDGMQYYFSWVRIKKQHGVGGGKRCFCVFIRPSLRQDVLWYTNVRLSVRPFHMSRSNLRTPWSIHFKLQRVIGIDGLTVCILYGEISNFHSRVMGLYSSNCRRFFICRALNWEPLGQFTSKFA